MPDEPAFYEGSRPVHEPEATKIDAKTVARCKLPPLTPQVVESMAQAAFRAMEEQDGAAPQTQTPWISVTEGVRECWRFIAKRAYAALAGCAGARPEGIKEPKGD